jgi:hypothetical protein
LVLNGVAREVDYANIFAADEAGRL